jgi:hypothetical protein
MAFGAEQGAQPRVTHDSYQPLLPSDIPYIHAGYAEFPPEVGNESKYPYVRDTHHDFN